RLAVASNVGLRRVGGVGPPVVALGVEVVKPALASRRARGGDRHRLLVQVAIRLCDHTRALDGDHLGARWPHAPLCDRRRSRQDECKRPCENAHHFATRQSATPWLGTATVSVAPLPGRFAFAHRSRTAPWFASPTSAHCAVIVVSFAPRLKIPTAVEPSA